MGNTQPTNRTGQKQTAQKLENAKTLGILSLSEHNLIELPNELYTDSTLINKLRVLDVSDNKLSLSKTTPTLKLKQFKDLKTLKLDNNMLYVDSIQEISYLSNLQNLSLSNNQLGKRKPSTTTINNTKNKRMTTTSSSSSPATKTPTPSTNITFPQLPNSLKQLHLSSNQFSSIPPQILSKSLIKLEKLDLSNNQLIIVPDEISNVIHLEELRLDNNQIVCIPESIRQLSKLKVLSLKNNNVQVPLPRGLFVNTKLIDLNLHGNIQLTNTIINQWDGFDVFLERRQKVKSKLLSGDPGDTCGLE